MLAGKAGFHPTPRPIVTYDPGKPLAVVAGSGKLPVTAARLHKAAGGRLLVVSLAPENADELAGLADELVCYSPGQVGHILKGLLKHNVQQLTFLGKVPKQKLFQGLKLDLTAMRLWISTRDKSDRGIMTRLCEVLAESGIEVVSQLEVLGDVSAPSGELTRRKPTAEESADAEFGLGIAAESARLGIGQCVVVRGGVVVAVEALEGTDACLCRAGELAASGGRLFRGGLVMAKVAGYGHDPRFDIPTVGKQTLVRAAEIGVTCLAVQSRMTIFADGREEFLAEADRLDVVVIGRELSSS